MIISVCDDNLIGRDFVRNVVLYYKKMRELGEVEVLEYASPKQLESDLDTVEADVYILEVIYQDGDGIELARQIRFRYLYNPILFITSSKEHAITAFGVYATGYLVKPVRPKALLEALDYACKITAGNRDPYLLINTVEGRQKLRFSAIMCVERNGQSLRITLNSGRVLDSVTLRESFASKVEPLLTDEHFVQTHVSFLVNLDAVELYQKDHIILQNGREIPISRKYRTIVKEKYNEYFG